MKMICRFFCFFLFTQLPAISLAQSFNDQHFFAKVQENLRQYYLYNLNSGAPIYNGRIYRPESRLDENGHTLFTNDKFSDGWITYQGIRYEHVKLMYDLVLDQLILLNFDEVGGIIVVKDLVDSFSVHKHTFINLPFGEKGIQPGYYDLLYDGRLKLLAKRNKKISETTNQYKVVRKVSQQNKYYLLQDGAYVSVKNLKALLKQLPKKHIQYSTFIKEQNLNIKKDKEHAMVSLLKFCDTEVN